MLNCSNIVNAWAVLLLLTATSFVTIEAGLLPSLAAVMIIGIAAYKARMIMIHFMEVNLAARAWRTIYMAWIIVAASIILIGNYMAVVLTS